MKIRIKVLGILELLPAFREKKEVQIDFPGDTIKDLLHQLFLKIVPIYKNIAISDDQKKISSILSISVNGRIVSDSRERLKQNDYIEIYLSSGG